MKIRVALLRLLLSKSQIPVLEGLPCVVKGCLRITAADTRQKGGKANGQRNDSPRDAAGSSAPRDWPGVLLVFDLTKHRKNLLSLEFSLENWKGKSDDPCSARDW